MLFAASATWLAVSVWSTEHPALVVLGLACLLQAPAARRHARSTAT